MRMRTDRLVPAIMLAGSIMFTGACTGGDDASARLDDAVRSLESLPDGTLSDIRESVNQDALAGATETERAFLAAVRTRPSLDVISDANVIMWGPTMNDGTVQWNVDQMINSFNVTEEDARWFIDLARDTF